VIGNKNYSSWSLRAWLHLRESGIPFEEVPLLLDTEGFADEVRRYSPAGRVPVLVDGDVTLWDSMAIIEYVLEHVGGAVGWPADRAADAMARSVAAEMHAGFEALRDELPQNLRAEIPLADADLSDSCRRDIARVESIWATARARYGSAGPWLFGEFSIADVVYAPVALRFATYRIPLGTDAQGFVDQILRLESVQEFVSAARLEPERLEAYERQPSR
jgi:glutathione S-transferase